MRKQESEISGKKLLIGVFAGIALAPLSNAWVGRMPKMDMYKDPWSLFMGGMVGALFAVCLHSGTVPDRIPFTSEYLKNHRIDKICYDYNGVHIESYEC